MNIYFFLPLYFFKNYLNVILFHTYYLVIQTTNKNIIYFMVYIPEIKLQTYTKSRKKNSKNNMKIYRFEFFKTVFKIF